MQKYDQAVRDAEQKLKDLQIKLDETLTLEITAGKDQTTAKTKLRAEIDSAEKELIEKQQERTRAYQLKGTMNKNNISIADLIVDYKNNYCPVVFDEEVKPIAERLAKAKSDYFNALLDLYEKDDEYAEVYGMIRDYAIKEKVGDVYLFVDNPVYYQKQIIQDAVITVPEIRNALKEYRRLPSEVKRIKEGK